MCFCANNLSPNIDKTKYVLFYTANFGTQELRNSLKFLGVMIEENLTWKSHGKLVQNKISKSVRMLFKTSCFLNSKSLQSIYFALFHPYINYINITWFSTRKDLPKQILSKLKQTARMISSDDISIWLRIVIKELNVLNVYRMNILQHFYLYSNSKAV